GMAAGTAGISQTRHCEALRRFIALYYERLVLTPSRIDGLLRVVISFARGLGLLLFGKGVPLWSRGIESR
ncbi:MAG: hypothetical protein ACPGXX_20320, partial [Planctomycetaceae bacterium]